LGYPIELGTKASIMPDGKIVVAGLVMQANGDGGRVGIAQYNADGTPDYTFGGGDGVVLTPEIAQLYGSLGIGTSNIAIQADGKVLVGHYSLNQSTSDSDAMLMRFNPDGTFDTSFGGGDGIATADLGSTTDLDRRIGQSLGDCGLHQPMPDLGATGQDKRIEQTCGHRPRIRTNSATGRGD
jgi:uncharacterized delta-60 repeat protein